MATSVPGVLSFPLPLPTDWVSIECGDRYSAQDSSSGWISGGSYESVYGKVMAVFLKVWNNKEYLYMRFTNPFVNS